MTDIATVVETYLAAWNEPDAGQRSEPIAQTFTDDATYLDPLMSGEGTDFAVVANDGRLEAVTGFLDAV